MLVFFEARQEMLFYSLERNDRAGGERVIRVRLNYYKIPESIQQIG